jgi:hypothetical protein
VQDHVIDSLIGIPGNQWILGHQFQVVAEAPLPMLLFESLWILLALDNRQDVVGFGHVGTPLPAREAEQSVSPANTVRPCSIQLRRIILAERDNTRSEDAMIHKMTGQSWVQTLTRIDTPPTVSPPKTTY